MHESPTSDPTGCHVGPPTVHTYPPSLLCNPVATRLGLQHPDAKAARSYCMLSPPARNSFGTPPISDAVGFHHCDAQLHVPYQSHVPKEQSKLSQPNLYKEPAAAGRRSNSSAYTPELGPTIPQQTLTPPMRSLTVRRCVHLGGRAFLIHADQPEHKNNPGLTVLTKHTTT